DAGCVLVAPPGGRSGSRWWELRARSCPLSAGSSDPWAGPSQAAKRKAGVSSGARPSKAFHSRPLDRRPPADGQSDTDGVDYLQWGDLQLPGAEKGVDPERLRVCLRDGHGSYSQSLPGTWGSLRRALERDVCVRDLG